MLTNLGGTRRSSITVKETEYNQVLVDDHLQDSGVMEKVVLK